jgi:Fe2+ transport system protein FeoA
MLSDLSSGSKAIISSFAGGRGCREKMTSMGLFPGTEICVVQTHGEQGMMLISVGSARLMVDRMMAARVLVEKAG